MSPRLLSRLARRALLVALVAAPARAQEPAPDDLAADPRLRQIQQALLAGEVDRGRALIVALESNAAPAELRDLKPAVDLLAAATSAPLARPDAMLAVAEKWPEQREGAVALVAGLAAWIALRDETHDLFAPLLPSCSRREISIDAKELAAFDSGSDARRGAFRRALELLERRSAADADGDLKRRAQVLFADLETSTLEPIRLRSSQAPLLPRPRLEAVRLRIDRLPKLGTDLVEWFTSDHAAPPALDRLLEPEHGDDALPPLAPGIYGVELRSPESGWTAMRELLVSDLDFLVDTRGGACVVLALLNGRATPGVEVTFDDDGAGRIAPETGRTGPDGTLLLHLYGGRSRIVARCAAERGEQVAVFRWPCRCTFDAPGSSRDPLLAHWMVDAPLHRRGETVRGRVVAHDFEERPLPTPDGALDSEQVARPLANEPLVLRFWPDSKTERTVHGRSDVDGLLAFELPLDDDAPFGPVPVRVERDGGRREESSESRGWYDGWNTPFSVEAVRRPPLLLEVGWPPPFARGAPRPAVRIAARLPSGAPAGELAGTLSLSLGSFSERHDFRLDPGGEASLPIACDTLPAAVFSRHDPGELHLSITAPDGQVVEESASLKLVEPATDPERSTSAEDEESLRFIAQSDPARAGDEVEFELAGPKLETLLVTAGRAEIWWHRSVRLDENGRARLSIQTRREWQPGFYVRAASLRQADRSIEQQTTWLPFPRPGGEVRAELDEHDARFAPGTRTTLHVTTRDEEGHPVAALVSVAIVDESLYLLSEDRTVAPWQRLLPSPRIDRGDVDRTTDAGDPLAVLGPMFELGRMKRAGPCGLGGGGSTCPGAGGCVGSTSLSLRDDLRPIAAFIPRLKTGADGRASFPVDLPGDLTRWRVTLVSVSNDGHGEITKSSITTVRDPSVLILAPRFLRSGDELEIPAVANASDGPARSVVLRADASPDYSLPGARELSELAELLTPGTPITKSWRLRGDAEVAGHAWFTIDLLDAASGTRLDGERRELPIESRTIERPCAATVIVCGGSARPIPPIIIEPPTLADALSSRVTVELLGDRAALLDSASRWLEGYPYGCAEQTLSRLVPLFAAARARNLARPPGAPCRRPLLTSEQARRFESGMARLRDMKSSDGYAWWRGGHPDAFMTPVILTGLALAREAGLDPDAYRAVADLGHGAIRACVTALAKADGDPRVAEGAAPVSAWLAHQDVTVAQGAQLVAEMAVAVLRLVPADGEAQVAVAKLIACDAPLSTSLLFRAGLALVRGGSREAAARAFERATGDDVNPRCILPLEAAPEALAAERLELARALGRSRAELDAAEAELLGLFNDDRFGTTWTTALALCALADDGTLSAAVASDSDVVVRAGGRERIVRLDESNRRHALLDVGDVPTVELSSALPTHVVAVVTRRHAFDGVSCRGWSEPLHVERHVSKWSATPKSAEGNALESMADGSLRCRAGDILEIEMKVTGPADLTYFVVTCPLPAGCELVGRADDFERRGGTAEDARLIWAFRDLDELGWRHARARIVAAHSGVVGWPAAQAEAMYRPATSGAGSGTRLVIEPMVERPRDEDFTWLTPKARAVRRDELAGEVMSHAEGKRARYEALWDLRRFPDEVAETLFQRLDPSIVEWDDEVGTLLELLGDRRAALLDGASLSRLVAKAGWHDVTIGRASLGEWARALNKSDEGRALIDRWRRDDPALGPIEKRIAAAATLEAAHWSDEPLDPERTLRTLRALDFAGDEPLAEGARAEREWLLESIGVDQQLEQACCAIVEREGVRTQPREPAAFAPLAQWQALLAYVRGELDRDEPSAESCRLAGRLIEWRVPKLSGAAPFPEERAIESSIASLRTSLMGALVRLLGHGDLGRFGGDVPGRGILQAVDRAAAESWLLAAIDAADRGSGCLGVEFVVDRLDEYADSAALDSPLGRRLVEIADHGPPEWCAPALKTFPVAERARLPVALLTTRRSVHSDPEGPPDPAAWLLEPFRVDALAETAAGRATVLAAIRTWKGDDDGRADPLARVVMKSTAAELAALPDALLLELFPEFSDAARDCVRSEFVRRARDSRAAAEAFADRLAQPQDRRARELLVEVVAAADGVDVIWDGDDPAADRYRTLLAARRGDPEALDQLRRSIRTTKGRRDPTAALPSDELLVAEQTLLTHGTADDLDGGLFEEVDRAARLARFGRFGRDRYERERTIDWPRELIERGVALR